MTKNEARILRSVSDLSSGPPRRHELARTLRHWGIRASLVIGISSFGLAPPAAAATFVQPAPGWEVAEHLAGAGGTAEAWPAALTVVGQSLVLYDNLNGLEQYDLTTGALVHTWGKPGDYAYMTASFVTPDLDGLAYWVGFTTGGNTDDRIYRVDAGGSWTYKATLRGNFDLEFHYDPERQCVDALASANPSGMGGPNTCLYRSDPSAAAWDGSIAFDPIIDVGGFSAGLAVDHDGNVYYGTYSSGAGNVMYRFPHSEVVSAIDGGQRIVPVQRPTQEGGHLLFNLPAGAGALDVDVDQGGRLVFVSAGVPLPTPYDGLVALVDPDQAGFSTIATASIGEGYLSTLAVAGDLSGASGRVFLTTYGLDAGESLPGVTTIARLPGDANGDGQVDGTDASMLAAHWLQSEGAAWMDGDFNGDGAVDDLDASILAAHWRWTGQATRVPEPPTLALLAALLLGCHVHARRKRVRSLRKPE